MLLNLAIFCFRDLPGKPHVVPRPDPQKSNPHDNHLLHSNFYENRRLYILDIQQNVVPSKTGQDYGSALYGRYVQNPFQTSSVRFPIGS